MLTPNAPPSPRGHRVLRIRAAVLIAGLALGAPAHAPAGERVLRVGLGHDLLLPSDAARVARDGDVVEIDAGIYVGDVAVWAQNRLTLRGVGGRAHLQADGNSVEGKAIWVIKGADTTVEGIEFSGAKVPDRNGAGIRQEGPGLVVRDCYFHDNETGILTSPNPESDILIENSEFARNGHPDGQSHNMYIGTIRSFTLRGSNVHHAVIGSNVKSRALVNRIEYNRIADEMDGQGNYSIDLSNGGRAYIVGNVIEQGPHTENYHLIAFAPEGMDERANELFVVHNTMVNDRADGRFVWNNTPVPAKVYNNVFVGGGQVLRGDAILAGNVVQLDIGLRGKLTRLVFGNPDLGGIAGSTDNIQTDDAGLYARFRFDYRLAPRSPAIDAGIPLPPVDGTALLPTLEYAPPLGTRAREPRGPPDAGAFEERPISGG